MIKLFLIMHLVQLPFTAFTYRENNPSALFHYSTAIADEFPPAHLSNPSFLPLWNAMYITTAYSKPYMLEELNAYDTRAGCSGDGIGVQAGLSSFGIDEYREQILDANCGYRAFEYLSMGFGAVHYRVSINTDEFSFQEDLTDARFAILFMPASWLKFGYLQQNIRALFDSRRKDMLFPDWSVGVSLKPARGTALIWNINRSYYGYINSFAVSANLLPCLGLRAGYSRETSTGAVSAVIVYRLMQVSYGMQYHSYLGTTHSLALTISTESIPLEEIRYREALRGGNDTGPRDARRIDINRCSADELRAVSGLPDDMVERIMKYRQMIGPVSEKSLHQIGMTAAEVQDLEKRVCGLASDIDDRKDGDRPEYRPRTVFYTAERRKEVFTRLLKAGVPSGISIRVAELMKNRNRSQVIEELRRMNDIPAHIKESLINICGDLL